jgi:hypothetical protein
VRDGGSVLSSNLQAYSPILAAKVLRIHWETFCLLAFAAASTRLRSSGLNRTGTIVPLASFFASLGRPGFLGFWLGIGSGPLNDECPYGYQRALGRVNAGTQPHTDNAFYGPDAGAFRQCRDDCDLLIRVEIVRHKASPD